MDPVSPLNSGTDTSLLTKAPNAFSDLTSEQFVKIMFTELSNQDPLKPNDSASLMEQMANLRSIQSDLELSGKLEALTTRSELAAAGALIGRAVSGITEAGERATGLVKTVSRTKDGPVLNLSTGARVAFGQVDEMADAAALAPAPGGGTGGE